MKNPNYWISMGILSKNVLPLAEDTGVWSIIGLGKKIPTNPILDANSSVMNEWVAPESNE